MQMWGFTCAQCGKRDWKGVLITVRIEASEGDEEYEEEATLCSEECAREFFTAPA